MAVNVLKIGGNQLDDPLFIQGMAVAVRNMPTPPVIVHGGGKLISTLQTKLNLQPQTIGGLRVTDQDSLGVVMMVLIGYVNPTLVNTLTRAGVDAIGLNGADRGLLTAEKLIHPEGDLGFVGKITHVKAQVIHDLLAQGLVPVIAPLSVNAEGQFFNINADQAAGAIGAAIGAERVTFLTNVPGVLADGQPIARLTETDAKELIRIGIASGGMAVKLEAAFTALSAGVGGALITDLEGVLDGRGTLITR
jgi:acetylglutamate kinase